MVMEEKIGFYASFCKQTGIWHTGAHISFVHKVRAYKVVVSVRHWRSFSCEFEYFS